MNAMLLFLAGIAAIAMWWLARHGIMSKPWLEVGHATGVPGGSQREEPKTPAEKVGLGVFLVVVGSLFTLFISAYLMRVDTPDWWGLALPRLLYVNTAILFVSSLCLHWAKLEAVRVRREGLKTALLAAFATALAFVAGQVLAWRQLVVAGYTLTDDAAASFFYVITGLHGLHILGGMVALVRTARLAWSEGPMSGRLRLDVELCAIYWHFMLAVWLVLLALFAGWASNFVDLCRQLLT
ncbi:cytochrome c oxidase subunit 3 [Rhizobium sp. ARZ01]|uniref:cytochrome c oxidase subunit 3 n=1 Tax=Rhizobium sp. ARZ01 TaxID=2769313 RepID=UPI00177CF12B|nr:cytochrome c oxidase subunit 3 [Rhizobium sp. ARZ01]MBD9374788.1 cytochrome c oxidase subunit 3 [Rhizobium sp. ARZ01]